MTEALLKTGKHTVTVLTRFLNAEQLPSGVQIKQVNYDEPSTLISALRGQDALVITLSATAPKDTHSKIIHAAASANVPWILPNEWCPDANHAGLIADAPVFASKAPSRQEIADLGTSSYIAIATGFWYEWMLGIGPATFGFDIKARKATFFDDGETGISVSTWPQVGQAVASLLSLPIKDQNGACLEKYRNQLVYINSFTICQRDMLDSLVKVTKTRIEDWVVEKQDVRERFREGNEQAKAGNLMGFAQSMSARVFYPDGNGDFETNRGTLNAVLRLPKEDLDQATAVAVERALSGGGWGH